MNARLHASDSYVSRLFRSLSFVFACCCRSPLQQMGLESSWLEVEARLYFVSMVANRIRLVVSPPHRGGASEGGTNIGAAGGVASTSPGQDDYVFLLLQILPSLPFPAPPRQAATNGSPDATEQEVVSLFLHAAAARTIAWLCPRVVPQHQGLFAPLFFLLATQSLQFVASLPVRPPPYRRPLVVRSCVPVSSSSQ